jgi:hypothetical protein
MKKEQSFESMVREFQAKVNELQTPPASNLSEAEFEILRKDRELRSKSANYRLLGEDSKADALESEILNIQNKVMSIKEKLSKAPSGQQEIDKTIAATPDSKLHKEALKIQKAGLAEYEKILKKIEESEKERMRLHNAVGENAKQRGILERRKYDLFLKLRQIEKALPTEKHKAVRPQKAPEWSHFLPDEDRVGGAYGQRPYLIQGRY